MAKYSFFRNISWRGPVECHFTSFADAADGGLCLARQVVTHVWLQLSLPPVSARGNFLAVDNT